MTTWVAGAPADRAPVTDACQAAEALASFLAALHVAAPDDAPGSRHGRGGPLAAVEAGVEEQLSEAVARGLVEDPVGVRALVADAVAASPWVGAPVWLHADLHPANVLTERGRLSGVIDFGDLCAGDPACDLASGWILLPDEAADDFCGTLPGLDDATWRRARGWAVAKALVCLLIGDAGDHSRPGGKASWGPPATASLRRLVASR